MRLHDTYTQGAFCIQTGFVISVHSLINITLLTLWYVPADYPRVQVQGMIHQKWYVPGI